MKWYLLCTALVVLSQAALLPIIGSSTDSFLRDSEGRVRIFHGIQAVQKEFPWYENWPLNDTHVAIYASWGINAVRIGWMWSGFEPTENRYNTTYFDISKTAVDTLAAHGMYSLLDTHQDCFSSKFCLYDGIPIWVEEKMPPPRFAFPFPFSGNCSERGWMLNCLTDAAGQAYQSLYDNVNGMRDAFVAFWGESSKRWNGNANILGYELINEPFAGDIFGDPLLLLPGNAGRWNLQYLYAFLSKEIRKNDQDHLIFFEPVTWGMLFDGKVVGSGFSEVPGGNDYRNRSVFSYHYYCSSFGGDSALCKDFIGPDVFSAVKEDLSTFGGSSMLTEFAGPDSLDQTIVVMDLADANLQSWMLWDGFAQLPSPPLKNAMIRTYAQAIAGVPIVMHFNSTSYDFHFCYEMDGQISAPTLIYVPVTEKYGGKPKITHTENVVAKFTSLVELEVTAVKAGTSGPVCVDITA